LSSDQFPLSRPGINVGPTERMLSAGLGGALLFGGYARGRATGALLALAGAALLLRGVSGFCPAYAAQDRRLGAGDATKAARRDSVPRERRSTATAEVLGGPQRDEHSGDGAPHEDLVQEASEQSFPASDPPAYYPASASGSGKSR